MWCVLTWHFSALHTKPSGAQCARAGARLCLCASVCLCAYAMCSCTRTCEREDWIWGTLCSFTLSPVFAILTHSHHTVCDLPQSHRQKENRGRTRLWKVYLVSWQHPKLQNSFETSCIEGMILNYSEIQISFCFGPKQRAKLPG